MASHAFVFLTHVMSERIREMIDRTRSELEDTHDVIVLGYFKSKASIPADFLAVEGAIPCTMEDLASLGFCGVAKGPDYSIIPGDADIPILWLARERGPYETVWVFEGDVDFTGSIGALVRHFSGNKDHLIASNVRTESADTWDNFNPRRLPEDWPKPEDVGLCAFLPAFRVSGDLLDAIREFYAAGGRGHHEWVWPQVAFIRGFKVSDFLDMPYDGRPLYVRQSIKSPSLGTFRYKPVMLRPGRRRNTLWHPVKERHPTLSEIGRFIRIGAKRLIRRAIGLNGK